MVLAPGQITFLQKSLNAHFSSAQCFIIDSIFLSHQSEFFCRSRHTREHIFGLVCERELQWLEIWYSVWILNEAECRGWVFNLLPHAIKCEDETRVIQSPRGAERRRLSHHTNEYLKFPHRAAAKKRLQHLRLSALHPISLAHTLTRSLASLSWLSLIKSSLAARHRTNHCAVINPDICEMLKIITRFLWEDSLTAVWACDFTFC